MLHNVFLVYLIILIPWCITWGLLIDMHYICCKQNLTITKSTEIKLIAMVAMHELSALNTGLFRREVQEWTWIKRRNEIQHMKNNYPLKVRQLSGVWSEGKYIGIILNYTVNFDHLDRIIKSPWLDYLFIRESSHLLAMLSPWIACGPHFTPR